MVALLFWLEEINLLMMCYIIRACHVKTKIDANHTSRAGIKISIAPHR